MKNPDDLREGSTVLTQKPEATPRLDDVTAYLLKRLRRPHVAGRRRDMDVVIIEGGWYRDVLELLNRIDVDGGA